MPLSLRRTWLLVKQKPFWQTAKQALCCINCNYLMRLAMLSRGVEMWSVVVL
jgi:hypothetical protein